jgi:hypothetical protein
MSEKTDAELIAEVRKLANTMSLVTHWDVSGVWMICDRLEAANARITELEVEVQEWKDEINARDEQAVNGDFAALTAERDKLRANWDELKEQARFGGNKVLVWSFLLGLMQEIEERK